MLTVKMSNGTEVQYDISSDVNEFVEDFTEGARDIVVDDIYYEIVNDLLTDLFENKLPEDGEISEEEIEGLIGTMYYGESVGHDRPLGIDAQYWIHDYVMYGLYLGNAEKFKFSRNADSARGVRLTGDKSGYLVLLTSNNKGIEDPIMFQLTSISADSILVHGGVSPNYIDREMDANSAIQLLLDY